jgi:hypothetical protein
MSFSFRNLQGWFHIFTSLPLVHMSTQIFWGSIVDLASLWSPNFHPWLPNFGDLYTCFRRYEILEPRWYMIPDFHDFLIPNSAISWFQTSTWVTHLEIDRKFEHKGPRSAIIFTFVQKLVNHSKLVKTRHMNLFPVAVSQTCFMNFGSPTFRRWQDFTEFPNTPLCKAPSVLVFSRQAALPFSYLCAQDFSLEPP